MRRGEVWWASLPPPWGRRPVLLLSRNETYERLTRAIVAPITSRIRELPSTVRLDPRPDGVLQPCVVTLDNLHAIPVTLLSDRMVFLREAKLREVEWALHFVLALRNCP